MKITGEELYVAWKKWVDSEETRKTPFVIQSETWWGDERYVMVRDIRPTPNSDSKYEVKLFNHKFRPITLFISKAHEFEFIEDGRFKSINWR